MTAAKRARWVCPLCGRGALAPRRMAADATARYCLPCSSATGKLVKRGAPALDRTRAVKATRAAAKRATVRDRAADKARATRTRGGVDLLAEARRLWRLPALADRHRGRALPVIEFRNGTRYRSSGHCYGRTRIVITAGTDTASAVEVVAHELAHAATPGGHTDRFWRTLRQVAIDGWPGLMFGFGTGPQRGWQLDELIARGIRSTLDDG